MVELILVARERGVREECARGLFWRKAVVARGKRDEFAEVFEPLFPFLPSTTKVHLKTGARDNEAEGFGDRLFARLQSNFFEERIETLNFRTRTSRECVGLSGKHRKEGHLADTAWGHVRDTCAIAGTLGV